MFKKKKLAKGVSRIVAAMGHQLSVAKYPQAKSLPDKLVPRQSDINPN